MTRTVIEAALNDGIVDHLGDGECRNRANSRNGTRSTTVLTDSCGEVDEVVLSLYARGLTTGRSQGAKLWLAVLSELKNCGVADVSTSSATASRPARSTPDLVRFDLQPVYTAPPAADARRAYEELAEK